MEYGYARCSTNESKQDINRQKRELQTMGVKPSNIYYEYCSGVKQDKEQWSILMSKIQKGDTIVCTEVSRITRSTKQLCEVIEMARDVGIKLVIGSFVVDFTSDKLDAMTEGMLKMMGVFAEMERNIISERVKSGMANAKAKGKEIGRPKMTGDKIPSVFMKYYPMYKKGEINVTELSKLCEMSRTTVYKYIELLK